MPCLFYDMLSSFPLKKWHRIRRTTKQGLALPQRTKTDGANTEFSGARLRPRTGDFTTYIVGLIHSTKIWGIINQ